MLPIEVFKLAGGGGIVVKYWKIEFDHASFPFNNFVSEIEFHESVGGANVSIGGTTGNASGNGTNSGNAFDQNAATATEWVWTEAAPYIIFSHNSPVGIVEFSWKFLDGGGLHGPTTFRLLYSELGVTYTLLKSWATAQVWADGEVRTFQV